MCDALNMRGDDEIPKIDSEYVLAMLVHSAPLERALLSPCYFCIKHATDGCPSKNIRVYGACQPFQPLSESRQRMSTLIIQFLLSAPDGIGQWRQQALNLQFKQ